MIYVGYKDPLLSQLLKMLRGDQIEIDNKAIELFDQNQEEEKRNEFGFKETFIKPTVYGILQHKIGFLSSLFE